MFLGLLQRVKAYLFVYFLCWPGRHVIAASECFNFGPQVASLRNTMQVLSGVVTFILSAPLLHKMRQKICKTELKTPEIVQTYHHLHI